MVSVLRVTRRLVCHSANFRWAIASILAGVLLAVTGSNAYAAVCESLLSAKLPNTTINGAESIPAGTYQPPGSATAFTDLPAFCRVTATVSPVPDSSIGIEVWLPTTTWNGRYQQVGNHGWGGTIYWSEMAPQLRRGFATGATDDGHVDRPSNPFDVSWAFGHPAKIDDFAWRAVHELAEKAKLLIDRLLWSSIRATRTSTAARTAAGKGSEKRTISLTTSMAFSLGVPHLIGRTRLPSSFSCR